MHVHPLSRASESENKMIIIGLPCKPTGHFLENTPQVYSRIRTITHTTHILYSYQLMKFGIIDPRVPTAIDFELGVGYEDAVRVLVLTGYFVVWKKVGKLLNKIQYLYRKKHYSELTECRIINISNRQRHFLPIPILLFAHLQFTTQAMPIALTNI